jgi:threonine dehydratase
MAGLSSTPPLTRASVEEAHQLIKSYIHLTPVLTSTTLSTIASTPQLPSALNGTPPAHPRINLFFKCENYQRVGAFKSRGAFHALARLSDDKLTKGVVTHSSGTSRLAITSSFKASIWLMSMHRQPRTSPRLGGADSRHTCLHCHAQH